MMNIIILSLSALYLLTGCGAINQAQLNTAMQKVEIESAACDISRTEKKWSYSETIQCKTDALQEHALPVYQYKPLLLSLIADLEEIALRVDEGKLTEKQAKIEMQRANIRFTEAETRASETMRTQQSAAMMAVGQALVNASEPQPGPGNPTSTIQCNEFGGTVTCNQW